MSSWSHRLPTESDAITGSRHIFIAPTRIVTEPLR